MKGSHRRAPARLLAAVGVLAATAAGVEPAWAAPSVGVPTVTAPSSFRGGAL